MKLRVGETWLDEETGEQFVVEGLELIDRELPVGEVVVPNNGDDMVEGRVTMPLTGNVHTLSMSLRELNEKYDRAGKPP